MGCDGRDTVACYGYAVALEEGIGGAKNPEGAKKVFKALCDAGMKEACKEL
jgi:TPR repeat protein